MTFLNNYLPTPTPCPPKELLPWIETLTEQNLSVQLLCVAPPTPTPCPPPPAGLSNSDLSLQTDNSHITYFPIGVLIHFPYLITEFTLSLSKWTACGGGVSMLGNPGASPWLQPGPRKSLPSLNKNNPFQNWQLLAKPYCLLPPRWRSSKLPTDTRQSQLTPVNFFVFSGQVIIHCCWDFPPPPDPTILLTC